jgi:hypothetical protein
MPAHAGQLVGAVHAGHIDAHQALVAGQGLEILARQLIQTWAPQAGGTGQEAGHLEAMSFSDK